MRVRVGVRKIAGGLFKPAGITGYAHEAAEVMSDGLPMWVEIDGVRRNDVLSVEHNAHVDKFPTMAITAYCESYEIVDADEAES